MVAMTPPLRRRTCTTAALTAAFALGCSTSSTAPDPSPGSVDSLTPDSADENPSDAGEVLEDMALGREPPPPPPSEPPEAAQPAPIVGPHVVEAGNTVETLAGGLVAGEVDGAGDEARFHNPVSVALGPDGDLFVADFDNDKIRRVTPDGQVSTVAGTSSKFQRPFGLAFDDLGRLFVQTDGNPAGERSYYTSTVWEVDPKGSLARSIIADIGRARGIAPLEDGQLMLTDNAWHKVRILDPDTSDMTLLAGSVVGVAGYVDGSGDAVRFFRPYGAVRLPTGGVVVADARNHCLREVSVAGVVSTHTGRCGQPGYVDGEGGDALFNTPQDVAIDIQGELFVTDLGNHRIRMVGLDGKVTTVAGDGTEGHLDGPAESAQFFGQEGLDVTPDGLTIYVADGDRSEGKSSHCIRAIRRGSVR